MILDIKNFRETCKTISNAVDTLAGNLELKADGPALYLSVTNKEYFASIKYDLQTEEHFRAVVDATLFLNLISGITTDEIKLTTADNYVQIKVGKSNYKLPMIYENNSLISLPPIKIENINVEMPITNTVLQSILNVNGKEIAKLKAMTDIKEIQKLYYITNDGCFTFTNTATMNAFTLEKPIKLFLNDRIVKLFKLFKEDVMFTYGHDMTATGQLQTKVCFQTENIYLAAFVTEDSKLFNSVIGPYEATKSYISDTYPARLVVSVNQLSAAINRLTLFTKNSATETKMNFMPVTIELSSDEVIIKDAHENIESIQVENESFIADQYSMLVNLADFKAALSAYKDEHVTINCGNGKAIVITHDYVSNILPELRK